MEPLYKTMTKYNFEEYKKFARNHYWKGMNMLRFLIIYEIIFIPCFILTKNTTFLCTTILLPIFLVIFQNIIIKKVYNSSKITHDLEASFEFYQDFFMKKDKTGETKIEYSNIHKIIETKTHFYIMIAINQGYILVKENFPEGLENFIKRLDVKRK